MEKFLLNFTNSFRVKFYTPYTECIEYRCGLFQFDNFRPLPWAIIDALNLIEIEDWDFEQEKCIYAYTPKFELP